MAKPQNGETTNPPRTRPGRMGPRPLPLHLLSAMTAWMSSTAALSFSKGGSPLSNPMHAPATASAARELAEQLAAVAPEEFAAAVDRELRGQADAFLRGLEAYRHHPYRRAVVDPPVVWHEGTTRLLDYGPAGGVPLLVVPSLINRSTILDLAAERSLLRFLAGQGIRPLLVDWGRPGPVERGFGLTDYIAGRLDAAFEAALVHAGAPLTVLGYCMGGLLAVALAQRRRREIAALALLATPWDFHAAQVAQARLLGSLAPWLEAACGLLGEVPVDTLQAMFLGLDPLLALRKFSRFATLDPASPEAQEFVALEDWLNDGVPLALPVARECLADWYGANSPARGLWRVAGTPILPSRVTLPTLVVVPARDRIVPPASASALAAALPQATRLEPPLGHIGMIVGRQAEALMWQPLAGWLRHK
ncbi:MAG: alpha/beta hydrolase [Rhodospirillales bacterium]|nr:alpha/beta hydrolase [Rhodospirillales bacterium]